MKVGLFDSGIGGLTVLKNLMKRYPHNEYIYFGDTLNLPYGSKTKDELMKLAKHNVELLLSFGVDIIIVACGTVSSNCLESLKNNYDIPIFGVTLPIINYLNNSNYKNIGIIATEATINSHIFKNNIDKMVYEIAAPKLVPMIEENKFDEEILDEYLSPYASKIDALVLGCTHYPILKPYFKKYDFQVLDMADFISLEENGHGGVKVYFSKDSDMLRDNVKRILGSKIKKYEIKQ